jgi:hypothetical protein
MATSQPWETQRASRMRMTATSGSIFAHDLADHELQGQAVFALLLLGDVAQQAAHGEGIAGLLALAQAQFQFQMRPSGVWWRSGARSIASPSRARRKSAATSPRQLGPKEILKGIESQQGGIVQAEASLPGGIGIEELPPGLSVAIISLEFSNRSRYRSWDSRSACS